METIKMNVGLKNSELRGLNFLNELIKKDRIERCSIYDESVKFGSSPQWLYTAYNLGYFIKLPDGSYKSKDGSNFNENDIKHIHKHLYDKKGKIRNHPIRTEFVIEKFYLEKYFTSGNTPYCVSDILEYINNAEPTVTLNGVFLATYLKQRFGPTIKCKNYKGKSGQRCYMVALRSDDKEQRKAIMENISSQISKVKSLNELPLQPGMIRFPDKETLSSFTDDELFQELRKRNYNGLLERKQEVSI